MLLENFGACASDTPISECFLLVTYSDRTTPWVVQGLDVEKMMAMDLGNLPVDSIAIPESSPLFQNLHHELTAVEDLSKQLTKYFPTYFVAALYEIQSLFAKAEINGYVVGGIPRDLLLYQQKRFELRDVDITVEGDALELGRFLVANSRNFFLVEEYPEFGTVKINYKDTLVLDIASTRKEVYPHAGALPEVIRRGVPLADDIIRRDFTMNGLAFSINRLGEVLDYTHGIEDIALGQVRVLHPVSFYEDPSRILRAIKFAIRFNFHLADETEYLLKRFLQYGAMVYKGGGDRIKYEMRSVLKANYQGSFHDDGTVDAQFVKALWLRFFLENNCLQLANMELIRRVPDVKIDRLLRVAEKMPKLLASLEDYIYYDYAFDVYLCFLFADLEDPEAQENTFHRLGLTRQQREAIEKFTRLKTQKNCAKLKDFSSATEIYQIFHSLPIAAVGAAIIDIGLEPETGPNQFKIALEAFKTYKRKWERITLELDGNNLIDMGVPQGKDVGETLKQLLNAKLAGRVSDRMSEIRFVQGLLSDKNMSDKNSEKDKSL